MMAAMWEKFVDTSRIYSEVVKEANRFGYARRMSGGRIGGGSPDHIAELRRVGKPRHRRRRARIYFEPSSLPPGWASACLVRRYRRNGDTFITQ